MRISEAAKQLGVSPANVRKAVRDGKIRALKVADAKSWPNGWRWDLDAATVETNKGRWKGRGKYRTEWVQENYPVRTLVIDPNEGDPPRYEGPTLADPASKSSGDVPWLNVLYWSLTGIVLVGTVMRFRQDLRRRAADERVQPTYRFDPITLRWYETHFGPERAWLAGQESALEPFEATENRCFELDQGLLRDLRIMALSPDDYFPGAITIDLQIPPPAAVQILCLADLARDQVLEEISIRTTTMVSRYREVRRITTTGHAVGQRPLTMH